MLTKTKIALAALIMLGSAGSYALAASENDGGNETGGYRELGPGGVVTDGVNPAYHRSLRGTAGTFAYVPGYAAQSKAYAYVPGHAKHKQTTR